METGGWTAARLHRSRQLSTTKAGAVVTLGVLVCVIVVVDVDGGATVVVVSGIHVTRTEQLAVFPDGSTPVAVTVVVCIEELQGTIDGDTESCTPHASLANVTRSETVTTVEEEILKLARQVIMGGVVSITVTIELQLLEFPL